ncbi:MAG: nucleoside deaminase [Lachnospiraceae bacterium]|nr:nucleoside deaminase [Lachnospiraceae bacterium]
MNKYMKLADDLARDNLKTNAGGPFGACIVMGGKIIGKGSNHVLANNDPTAHAEIMAIRDASKNLGSYDLSGCELYTSCFPCPMCLSASIWANIDKVYYGNTKEDADAIGFRDDMIYDFINKLSEDIEDVDGILPLEELDREETLLTFKAFGDKTDKTIY